MVLRGAHEGAAASVVADRAIRPCSKQGAQCVEAAASDCVMHCSAAAVGLAQVDAASKRNRATHSI